MPYTNGAKLQKLRLQAGLNKKTLADISGLSVSTIRRAEDGGNLQIGTIERIAAALSEPGSKIEPSDLVSDNSVHHAQRFAASAFVRFFEERFPPLGITQEELAHRLGVSPVTISRWKNGKSVPSSHMIRALGEILGVSPVEMEAGGFSRVSKTSKIRASSDTFPERLQQTAASIPNQNPLIRFGLSTDNKLALVPSKEDENDYETITALRSEMLAERGPINTLKERYAQNPNTPQAGLFGPLTSKYDEELSKDPKDINYATLYARGARFYAARVTANRQVNSKEWPEMDADEDEAIDAICALHGPLIMASAVGRRLVVDAHEYETTPETYRKEEEIIAELGEVLAAEREIVEPESAEALVDLTKPIEDDPQPARSRGVRLMVTGSALVTIVGGVAWLSAGGAAAATVAVPLALTTGAGMFLWEVVKKTDDFKQVTEDLAKRYDETTRKAAEQTNREQVALFERMRELVQRKRDLFDRAASLRPEFGWAKRFLRNDTSYTSVFIIDDDERFTSSLRRELEKRGITAGSSNTVEHALDYLSAMYDTVQAIILDPAIAMSHGPDVKPTEPNYSLVERLFEQLRSINEGLPEDVIVVTASPYAGVPSIGFREGVRGVILKKDVSNSLDELVELIRRSPS